MTEQHLIHEALDVDEARRWEIASGNRSVAKKYQFALGRFNCPQAEETRET